jgi:hypothetical protein
MRGVTHENEMTGFDFTAGFRDETLEVVSKSQIRFKGKASGRSGKRSPPEADEHLPEVCNAAIEP